MKMHIFNFNKFRTMFFSTLLLSSANCIAEPLELMIPELEQHGFTAKFVANQFGCQGENISPQILWKNLPEHAKSLVLAMFDPDAPTGSGWWHWVIVNIPVSTQSIMQSAGTHTELLPNGSQLIRNDFGVIQYGGPCPPEKTNHRYQFTLYALDIDHIEINDQTTPALIGFIANSHQIAKATVSYNYAR